jgi:ArsR family transcriptional regulator
MRPDRAYRALADTTRLRVLRLLRDGALCVGDLVSALGIPQPAASRHLAYLQGAGLVVHERRGQWSFYRLSPPRDVFHQRLLGSVAAAGPSEARRDDAALRALLRRGGCCPDHPGRRRRRGG